MKAAAWSRANYSRGIAGRRASLGTVSVTKRSSARWVGVAAATDEVHNDAGPHSELSPI